MHISAYARHHTNKWGKTNLIGASKVLLHFYLLVKEKTTALSLRGRSLVCVLQKVQ